MTPLKVTDRVKVLRSTGELEDDWYLWTDMTQFPEMAFTAPELIGVTVLKATDGSPLEEMLRPGNDVEWISKKVSLADLYSWQEPDFDPSTVTVIEVPEEQL